MIIFINGAFGIGKTAVARALHRRLPGTRLYDPEPLGVLLQRSAVLLDLRGRGTGDFQDMPAWRRWTIARLRSVRSAGRDIIVPMAFSNLDYFREIVDGAAKFEAEIRCFCLTAPLAVVEQRLRGRGADARAKAGAWAFRRAAECCAVHGDPRFGEPVSAGDRSAKAIADDLMTRLAPSKR